MSNIVKDDNFHISCNKLNAQGKNSEAVTAAIHQVDTINLISARCFESAVIIIAFYTEQMVASSSNIFV